MKNTKLPSDQWSQATKCTKGMYAPLFSAVNYSPWGSAKHIDFYVQVAWTRNTIYSCEKSAWAGMRFLLYNTEQKHYCFTVLPVSVFHWILNKKC